MNESKISDQSFSFQWVNHRRPDLLLVNKAKKKAFIVEFSVPFIDIDLSTCIFSIILTNI